MRLLLHIGATKTATSAVQHALYKARADLKDAGILYSERGVASWAHHLLFAALDPNGLAAVHAHQLPSDRLAYFRETAAAILEDAMASQCDTVILSSEYLWGIFEETLYAEVSEAFSDVDVELVCFVRDPGEWLMSYYLQELKRGLDCDFAAWFEPMKSQLEKIGFDSCDVIDRWVVRLRPSRTRIAVYDARRREDVLAAFCSNADIAPPSGSGLPEVVNPSPDARGVALLLAVNRTGLPERDKSDLRRCVLVAHSARPGSHAIELGAEAREWIAQRAARSNERLRSIFGVEL